MLKILWKIHILKLGDLHKVILPPGNVSAWILQITKNLAYDFLKKESRLVIHEDMDIYPQTPETPNDKLFVYQLINKYLSLTDRQILILHIIHGYKNREIAKLVEMPVGTVLWRYNKAMKLLKEKIKEAQDEE